MPDSLYSPQRVKVCDVCPVLLEQLVEGECIGPDGVVGVACIVWWFVVHVAVRERSEIRSCWGRLSQSWNTRTVQALHNKVQWNLGLQM